MVAESTVVSTGTLAQACMIGDKQIRQLTDTVDLTQTHTHKYTHTQ